MSTCMLTVMDLREDTSVEEFQEALSRCTQALIEAKLLLDCSGLMLRNTKTILDTDDRSQRFSFTMRFHNEAQAKAAIKALGQPAGLVAECHLTLQRLSENQIFSYWEDIEPD